MASSEYGSARTGWSWQVRGLGPFPIDMLRYDGAFPYQSDDARRIEESIGRPSFRREDILVVRLQSRTHGPTVERWRSFGWYVEPIG